MIIGVPKERKPGEKRVALTPKGVAELDARVLVETGAGVGSGYGDDQYLEAGAEVIHSLEELWANVDLLVKVKEPSPEEIPFFRAGLTVFSFLHPAAFPQLTTSMIESGLTALDYDLLTLENGRLPILEPMSIIAGRLSVQCGAYALQSTGSPQGAGVLLGGAPGVSPAKTVIIGCGFAGSSAAQVAWGMGAETVILDINKSKLEQFTSTHPGIRTVESNKSAIEGEIGNAQLVIGSVLVPGDKAPKLITRQMLQSMPPQSVIVDICIDQGGFAETSRPTTIENPTYEVEGVIHYCVANMPALVPRTATQSLTAVTLPWIKLLAAKGVIQALKESPPLLSSLTTYDKQLCNTTVGAALGITATPAAKVIQPLSACLQHLA